jgi:L-rhamnose-H+ transport protein
MNNNPLLGVLLHAIGGVAHGSFYAPLHKVKQWAWESGWLVQGVAAWLLTPWLVALLSGTRPLHVLAHSPLRSLALAYLFGAMWGFGSLTFGLTMRYLGMSLGMAVALGYCASFGTLIPPLAEGTFSSLLFTPGGQVVLLGVAICLGGIGLCGYAGLRKERELTAEQQRRNIAEFALGKGFLVATFSGIMSAGFAYGIKCGQPIAQVAADAGAAELLKNTPVFIVVMAGGFTVNCIWCLWLNVRNGSLGDYFDTCSSRADDCQPLVSCGDGEAATAVAVALPATSVTPLVGNYLYAVSAGAIWYTGFFFYGMGTTQMGRLDFASWSIHLAFVIVFSTLCGILAMEWKGISRRTAWLVTAAIVILIVSTMVTGWGSQLASQDASRIGDLR